MDRKPNVPAKEDEMARRQKEHRSSPDTSRPRNPQDTGDRDPEEEGSAGKTQI